MKNKIILLILVLSVVISGSISAQEAPVEAVSPEIQNIREVKTINATLAPYKTIRISSTNGGIIKKLNVELGQYVEKGEEMLTFDVDQLQVQVEQAEAGLEIARANYKMLQDGAVEEEKIQARAAYEQAEASLEGAENSLELLKTIYQDRTGQKQQLITAESQLESAKKQFETSEERKKQADIGLEQAENSLEQAQKEYDRMEYLYQEEAVSQQELDMAESQLKNARSAVKNAESAVENARIARKQAEINLKAAESGYQLARKDFQDPVQLEQQVESARTQLEVARANKKTAAANLDRIEKGARAEELTVSKANIKQAEAALESARLALDDAVIKSPIAGVVTELNFEEEEMAAPGNPILNIVNIDKLYIEADVSADVAARLQAGDTAQAEVLAFDDVVKQGQIKMISPTADSRTQAFKIKLLIDNQDRKLKGGMFVDLYLTTDSAEDALVVPVSAVLDLDGTPYLFVVEDGKAVRKQIETGIVGKDFVQILSGVSEAQNVISKGQHNLQDGDQVEVVE